jgi:hypothetical protein
MPRHIRVYLLTSRGEPVRLEALLLLLGEGGGEEGLGQCGSEQARAYYPLHHPGLLEREVRDCVKQTNKTHVSEVEQQQQHTTHHHHSFNNNTKRSGIACVRACVLCSGSGGEAAAALNHSLNQLRAHPKSICVKAQADANRFESLWHTQNPIPLLMVVVSCVRAR